MYDDLSSLTEKLKLPGVSFQVMKDEKEGDTQATAGVTLVAPTAAEAIVQSVTQTQPPRRKEVPPAALTHEAFGAHESDVRENVLPLMQTQGSPIAEKNPVKLDRLFATISKQHL